MVVMEVLFGLHSGIPTTRQVPLVTAVAQLQPDPCFDHITYCPAPAFVQAPVQDKHVI